MQQHPLIKQLPKQSVMHSWTHRVYYYEMEMKFSLQISFVCLYIYLSSLLALIKVIVTSTTHIMIAPQIRIRATTHAFLVFSGTRTAITGTESVFKKWLTFTESYGCITILSISSAIIVHCTFFVKRWIVVESFCIVKRKFFLL